MEEYEFIWSALPIPAVLIDAADRITAMNPAAESFLNYSQKQVRSDPVWDRINVDAPLEAAYERLKSEGVPFSINDVAVGGGARAPMQASVQMSRPEGRDDYLLLIQPRESAERIRDNAAPGSAARSAIGLSDMLAHEIKNPLAGISGAAQLLSLNLGPEDLELTDLIVSETQRIVSLIDQVAGFGDQSPPNMQPINLHDMLDRAAKSAQLGFGNHMHFHQLYDPSLPEAMADPDQVVQVFLNLIRNAAEANPKGGNITLRTFYDHGIRRRGADGRRRDVPLQVEIMDDGPGLPDHIRADIFQPFVSGRENGTGLGLALVSKIVSAHDGWISHESIPGKTVFRISFARAK